MSKPPEHIRVAMHATPSRSTRTLLFLALLALAGLAVLVPHGELRPVMEERWDPAADEPVMTHDDARMRAQGIANSAGQIAVLMTFASLALPYVKRPWALRWHKILGAPILVLAGLHTALFLADGSTRGWLPGLLSFAAFGVHGATSALKVALIRAWGPAWWSLVNRGSGWVALAMVIEHVLIASWHFGFAWWFAERG